MKAIKQIGCLMRFFLLFTEIFLSIVGSATAGSLFLTPSGEKIETGIDYVSESLNSKYGWVFGGHNIKDNGISDSCLSIVPFDGDPTRVWTFEDDIVQFFKVDSDDYVLLYSGKTFKIGTVDLSPSREFKPQSLLISDTPDLIFCTEVGFATKADPGRMSSCYRGDGAWDLEVYWMHIGIPPGNL
jgi:hypothetical protein